LIVEAKFEKKIWDSLFRGVVINVTECDRLGEGVENREKYGRHFMDGPLKQRSQNSLLLSPNITNPTSSNKKIFTVRTLNIWFLGCWEFILILDTYTIRQCET